ncbi:hypothetical protein SISNIDRAFT_287063 [Sistotremastrum niveocremeum HHB9708]|uniref:Uncharacterized protein n=1 Tax=Sistotremastrum niveocremeum HHB9708 TaxID=1314777 RepID=A0A164YEC3_9AGAM|nr:hypothetical protein SISNIDRAFT_287063 [Sistotremastrum niveocremeum HHB9708]
MIAGRSAIVRKYKKELDDLGAPELQEVVEVYEMGGSTFYGSTGGIVPQGPASDKHLDTTSSYQKTANSSLELQGLQVSVSCAYIDQSPMTWIPADASGNMVNFTGKCASTGDQSWQLPNSNLLIGAYSCPVSSDNANVETQMLYFSHFGAGLDYQMIGNISCEVSGSIATGNLEYTTSMSAFSWTAGTPVETQTPSFDVVAIAMDALVYVLETGQSADGNLFIDAINSIYIPFVKDQIAGESNPPLSFLSMLETMTQGVVEYEASFLRLLFTLQMLNQTSVSTKPDYCARWINGSMTWPTFGWNASSHALLAYLPIGIAGLVMLFLLLWILFGMISSRLAHFDPTDLVSLAVASAGSTSVFPEGVTLDPDDERPRLTSVRFESVPGGILRFVGKPSEGSFSA